jgi:hypothetical protein
MNAMTTNSALWNSRSPARRPLAVVAGLLLLAGACEPARPPVSTPGLLGEVGRIRSSAIGVAEISDAVVLRDGSIALLDAIEKRVHLIRPDGGPAHAFGRIGHGPGEFETPVELATDGRSLLAISDLANRRVSFFTAATGDWVRDVQVPFLWTQLIGDTTGFYLLQSEAELKVDFSYVLKLRRLNLETGTPDTALFAVSVKAGQGMDEIGDACAFCDLRRRGPNFVTAAAGGVYRLAEFSARGAKLREWNGPALEPVRFSDSELAQIRAQWKRRSGRDEIPPYATKPRPFILSRSVGVDSVGRVWVRRTVPTGAPATFDVFSDAGHLASVELDTPVRQMRLLGSQLLVVTEDSAGAVQAIRYRVK